MIQLFDLPKIFTGNQHCFQGIVKPTAIDEENNILYVDLSNNGMEWQEEWDLQITLKGLEIGEYIPIELHDKGDRIVIGEHDNRSISTDEYEHELINMFNNPYVMDDYMQYPPLTKKQKNEIAIPVQPKSLINRNDICPCGSGLKYKKCCLNK